MSNPYEVELTDLASRYGAPLRERADLATTDFEPVRMTDRQGEVCMVIRRQNGLLLTAIKTLYPPGGYRLPTGGIHHGESVLAALHREIAEETGLEFEVRRLLAVVEYYTADNPEPVFTTVAFLLDELGGKLVCNDPAEHHGGFWEIVPADLLQRADVLEHIDPNHQSDLDHDWAAWGKFRAIIHRVVHRAMDKE